jgi:hypothetical protein
VAGALQKVVVEWEAYWRGKIKLSEIWQAVLDSGLYFCTATITEIVVPKKSVKSNQKITCLRSRYVLIVVWILFELGKVYEVYFVGIEGDIALAALTLKSPMRSLLAVVSHSFMETYVSHAIPENLLRYGKKKNNEFTVKKRGVLRNHQQTGRDLPRQSNGSSIFPKSGFH